MTLVAWIVGVAGYLLAVVARVMVVKFGWVSINNPLAISLILIGGYLIVVLTARAVRPSQDQDWHNGARPHG